MIDPARNIPDLLGDALRGRWFRQRHRKSYRAGAQGSMTPDYLIGPQHFLHEIGTIGDDGVDPAFRHLPDFSRLVDRPGIDSMTGVVERRDDAL